MAVLAAASLVMIPALIRAGGSGAWVAVTLGQSVGYVAAVVISFGWGVSGPASVARSDPERRWRAFAESLRGRASVAAVCVPAAVVIGAAVGHTSALLAAVSAGTSATVGLSSSWYFIGTRAPYTLFFAETLPRAAGTMMGIVAMDSGAGVLAGLAGQALGVAAGMITPILVVWRRSRGNDRTYTQRRVADILADQRQGVASSGVSAIYGALPIVLVSVVSPASLPVFAILDRLQKQLYTALQPVVAFLQGWVAHVDPIGLQRRILLANSAMSVFSLLVGAIFALSGGWLVGWLGANQIDVEPVSLIIAGLWLALNLEESVASKVSMIPMGMARRMAQITALGSVFGLGGLTILTVRWGANGALIGVCAGLLIRIALCLIAIRPAQDEK
jgi:hypothetical protein